MVFRRNVMVHLVKKASFIQPLRSYLAYGAACAVLQLKLPGEFPQLGPSNGQRIWKNCNLASAHVSPCVTKSLVQC